MRELLRSEPLRHPEVTLLILVGLAADRPIESISSPASLRDYGKPWHGRPGESNPPVSSREGAGRAWSTAVHGAISRTEQKEVEAPEAVGLPPTWTSSTREFPSINKDISYHPSSRTHS